MEMVSVTLPTAVVDAFPVKANDVAPRLTKPTLVVEELPVRAKDVAPRLTEPTAVVDAFPDIATVLTGTTEPTEQVAALPLAVVTPTP